MKLEIHCSFITVPRQHFGEETMLACKTAVTFQRPTCRASPYCVAVQNSRGWGDTDGKGGLTFRFHKYNKRQGSMQDVILKDEKRTDPFLFYVYVAAEFHKAAT